MNGTEIRISLAAARVNAKLTQSAVAAEMGIDKSTIVNWEKGRSEPTVTQALWLSDRYGIPIDNIFLPYNLTKSEKNEKGVSHETTHTSR